MISRLKFGHLSTRLKLTTLVVGLALPVPTLAMQGSELNRLLDEQMVEGDAFLSGLADGFKIRDALRHNTSRYEYCKPLSVNLTTSDYRAILQKQLRDPSKQNYISILPAYLVILIGLNEQYPCHKSD